MFLIHLRQLCKQSSRYIFVLFFLGCLWFFGSQLSAPQHVHAQTAPAIEVGQKSGVAGYPVRIFGTGFGPSEGGLTILGQPAQISIWEDRFVEAVVPQVAANSGALTLTTSGGSQATIPFTVYEINPIFLATTNKLANVAFGKPAILSGLESSFCFRQPENTEMPAEEFLTDYKCGFDGVNNVGAATFSADNNLNKTATIAINTNIDLAGEIWFKFMLESSWYPAGSGTKSMPADYLIEASANSTNGLDGSWTTLETVQNNNRVTRLHRFIIPTGGYTWVRMTVTHGSANNSAGVGNDFEMREIQIFKPTLGSSTVRPDTFALYGDSLTAATFDALGDSGIEAAIKDRRHASHDILFSAFGLSGKNSSGFVSDNGDSTDIYDAFALDGNRANFTYWGLAIGTNDALDGASGLESEFSNVSQFDERLDNLVQDMLANGQVPIIARFPDTDESRGGFGDIQSKSKLLGDIDQIAATYRLIPGPDLYATFRRNIETGNSSWFGDDGVHHSPAGEAQLIQQWAEAFYIGSDLKGTPPPPLELNFAIYLSTTLINASPQ